MDEGRHRRWRDPTHAGPNSIELNVAGASDAPGTPTKPVIRPREGGLLVAARTQLAKVSPATILTVGEEPENLSVLAALLRPTYRVLAAHSGTRALELAASDPKPDLILLDVSMLDMDGYTVLAHLKAHRVTRDIPVIFVTRLDQDDDQRRGLDLGAADCITTPLRPSILLARVRTQIELKQARDWMRDQ
ncbi:MAG: response regulator, partial [Betaproteobacteria bacterium]